jgi:molybdenum cofactor cytidylyltransferase
MMAYANIAVAVLGAGQGRRFGSDKLMADLDGIPLGLSIGQTLAPMAFGWRFLVCGKGAALTPHYTVLGFTICDNDAPEIGQAHSLHLAVRAAMETPATGLLIALADMPFVTATLVEVLLEKGDLTASFDGTRPLPPAFFPRAVWPQLLALSGDQGARTLLKQARFIAAPASQLRDIDTPADLAASI